LPFSPLILLRILRLREANGFNALRPRQATTHKVHIVLRRANSMRTLLLKCVKNVDGCTKAHSIHGPVGVAVTISDDLQDAGAAKPFEGFHIWVHRALLRSEQREPNQFARRIGERAYVVLRRPHEHDIANLVKYLRCGLIIPYLEWKAPGGAARSPLPPGDSGIVKQAQQ
jgi:hypothetical protein